MVGNPPVITKFQSLSYHIEYINDWNYLYLLLAFYCYLNYTVPLTFKEFIGFLYPF